MENVNIKGKRYSLDKVINVALLAPKGNVDNEVLKDMIGFDTAVLSDKVAGIIYVEFEGKKVVVVKSTRFSDCELTQTPIGTSYSFLTNMLVKKLNMTLEANVEKKEFSNKARLFQPRRDSDFGNQRRYSR